MSDQTVALPTPESAEHIPDALAAPKGKRAKAAPAAVPTISTPSPVALAPAAEPVSAPSAAAPAQSTQEENIMATTIENMNTTATEKTQAMFGDMSNRAKGAMEKSTKFFTELNGLTKGNVEALVESGKIVVSGMQSMGQDQAAYLRKQMEEATAAARSLASVKSPTEFMKLQGDYVRQQFDAMVAETSRSTEAMLKLAGEVVQPISNRVAVTVETFKAAA